MRARLPRITQTRTAAIVAGVAIAVLAHAHVTAAPPQASPAPASQPAQPPQPAAPAPPAQQQPRPQFETRADVVLVDVTVVSGNGEPVEGLTTADFQLTVNGQMRDINFLIAI